MEKRILTSETLKTAGPYSAAVEAGGLIFISGQLPIDPATGEIIPEIRPAARQVLVNLQTLLEENGLALANIVKTTIFLKSMADFAAVNDIYAEYFPSQPPARSTVEAASLPRGVLLEIEAVAVRR
ncbi:MAG: Rid family detoxifying hydrolase [Syntrophaceae bacterium]|jgi:2-iminobutanoate/2-iminopropanoate deaminase|nr:Rid family detoxifying hydrolase [Syntrophaceae bacterium]